MVFVAATNNKGKIAEISEVFGACGFKILSMSEAGIVCNPDETGRSFAQNALIKAEAVKELTEHAVIADDSGLMVEALGGLPGIYTARYAGEEHDDEKNIEKLLSKMQGLKKSQRKAWFVCAVTAILPDGGVYSAKGYTKGYIGFVKKGDDGFGYDPIFYVKGDKSFAELKSGQKDAVSHRGRALRKLAFKLKGIERVKGTK